MTDPGSQIPELSTDVVVLGAGLAGWTLVRQLLLETDCRIHVVERRTEPATRQKVGESTVQLAGHYLARVLDLEEELHRDHLLKYNLRFYWPTGGRAERFEDFSSLAWRPFSNVCSYQIDRNRLETTLEESAVRDSRVRLWRGISKLDAEIGSDGKAHRIRFLDAEGIERRLKTPWMVDATGRRRFLARKLDLDVPSPVRHGASFAWVDGRLDVERLTDRPWREVRKAPRRRRLGHTPAWLATNHFCGPGWWLWVIPLRDRTSLGLVFDREVVDLSDVSSPDRLRDWILERLPLFGPALEGRELLDHSGFRDAALNCRRALDPAGWALTGEAARFSDPLYSPGSDLIALHNTLIVDAIRATPGRDRAERCRRHDRLLKALHDAYLPAFTKGYRAIGDPETMLLKYSWELGVYFAFYVFPFLSDLFTDRRFVAGYLRRFARLGEMNGRIQELVADFAERKFARSGGPNSEDEGPSSIPVDLDLSTIAPLAATERAFYEVGLDAAEGKRVLDRQMEVLEELARWVIAHVRARLEDDVSWLNDPRLVATIDPFAAPDSRTDHPGSPRNETGPDAKKRDWGFDAVALWSRFRDVSPGPFRDEVADARRAG